MQEEPWQWHGYPGPVHSDSPAKNPAPLWIIVFQVIALAVMIGFRFAEPVGDGDLFWQMAYGKYMLEHGTLIPDHTIYSWTPADNPMIYCSWVAEIALYLMHQLGGLPLLFAFRYAVVGFTVLLAFLYARSLGWHYRAEFWVLVTWMVISSYVGSILKPELFSLGLLSLSCFLIFRFRLAAARRERFRPYLWALVLTMAVWANTHGVFFPCMIVFGAWAVGELLNWAVSPALALPQEARKPFLLALLGCGLAAFATPYTYHYVQQLLDETLSIVRHTQSAGDAAAYSSLAAHLPIWRALAFHFHEYLAYGMAFGMAVVTWVLIYGPSRGKVDWSYVLMNLVLFPLFCWSLRSTFYWPPCFLYSSLYLLHFVREQAAARQEEPPAVPPRESQEWPDLLFVALNIGWSLLFFRQIVWWAQGMVNPERGATLLTLGPMAAQMLVIALYVWARSDRRNPRFFVPRPWMIPLALCFQLYIVGQACKEAYYEPYSSSWCGFGITYWNPVDEVEFIKKYHPNLKAIINDYDSGGYLLWKLFPQTKVMIDPRSFPYRKFWAEYINYERGRIGLEFLDMFPGDKPDVSIVSLKNQALYRTYLFSKEWVPGWLGTAYVIFVRRGFQYPPDAAHFMPHRFETLRNSQKAFQIFQFGIDSQFYDISWDILEVMKRKFNSTPGDRLLVQNLEAFKESILAVKAKEYDKALQAQERCWQIGRLYNPTLLISLYRLRLAQLQKQGKGESDPAIQEILLKAQRLQQGQSYPQPGT